MAGQTQHSRIDLYWLPLGAGGRFVRRNGRLFEAAMARHEHRAVAELYHSALEVRQGASRFVIEMAPVWNTDAVDRGVVRERPVGTRWFGRSRFFRYEVRCWLDGRIPGDVRSGRLRAWQSSRSWDQQPVASPTSH
jgi:hypothetical protein